LSVILAVIAAVLGACFLQLGRRFGARVL
jgi:hypothetical protein